MTLGQYVRARREDAGVGLREAARVLNVSSGYVSKLESDESTLGLELAHRLATVIRVNRCELIELVLREKLKRAGLNVSVKVKER